MFMALAAVLAGKFSVLIVGRSFRLTEVCRRNVAYQNGKGVACSAISAAASFHFEQALLLARVPFSDLQRIRVL